MPNFFNNCSRGYRAILIQIIFIGGLLIATTSVGAVASPIGLIDTPASVGSEPTVFQSDPATANTSDSEERADLPPPHRNPEELEDTDNLSLLANVLSESLDQRLSTSLENLDAGDYERARELVGEEYTEDLGRYTDIAIETDSETQATQYQTSQSSQKEYIDSVEEYEKTEQEYEEARASGNDQRARTLARELVNKTEEVNTTANKLISTIQKLNQTTEGDFTDELRQLEMQTRTIQQTRQEIIETELAETTLSATANQSTVAFTDSLLVSGELRTTTGQPIEDQRVQFVVNDQSYITNTSKNGVFQLRLQPNRTWESGPVKINYIPDSQSIYLGTTTTLSVTVEPTETSVTIDALNQQAGYDKPVRVTGAVRAAETNAPVPIAPVSLRIDGEQTKTVQTTVNGEFEIVGDVPPRVSSGTVPIDIGLEPSPLALVPSRTEKTVRIEQTETNLSVTATLASPEQVTVTGELRSVGGREVPEVPVTIQIDNVAVETIETDQTGGFNETVIIPGGTDASDPVQVKAQFAGVNTNLKSSTAKTTVAIGGFDTTVFDNVTVLLVVIGALSLFVTVAGWWFWRESPTGKQTTQDGSPTGGTTETAAEKQESEFLLQAADEALERGERTSAAKLAYAVVRRHLRTEVAAGTSTTHWEWYQACAAAEVDRLSELQSLIEDFEQVVFTPDDERTTEAANRVVTTARELVTSD